MPSRLPNAPLIEVVFELHWKLEDFPQRPLAIDPGYATLADLFEGYAKRKGFGRQTELQPGYGGVGETVSRRFYKGEASFPIMQLGHGLYAANASVEYEWNSFRKLAIDGASFVVENYPKLRNFDLSITRLEIRYIDVPGVEWSEPPDVPICANRSRILFRSSIRQHDMTEQSR